ncbi:hypothetical protein ACJJIW_08880 [Microbulbifer sp. JMSA004]|uniref:hypothetical protein n=1 Tax=unclassified Microbulbifer TaxID=2619833 RepID=UPI0024AE28C5|nr:hypothetical protein [Microbulbifer sp. VAAF005]WHI45383.1 hypothetical protein P0078_16835 [Microbulbifer sp. VAAF005]
MKKKLEDSKYTILGPDDLWKFYNGVAGIYRGGGNTLDSKIVRASGPRVKDITVIHDPDHEIEMVIPNPSKGLSFASNIKKLSKNPVISGYVWVLPRGECLPEGLVFNVKDFTHPLLNVSRKMSLAEFTEKLKVLASKLKSTKVKIEKGTGRIIEEFPGALKKAEAI